MGLRNIAVTITGDGSSLAQALRRAAGEVDQLGRDVERSNEKTKLSWKTVGLAAVAAGSIAATALVSAGTSAAQFETRMRNVNSIVQDSEAGFRATSASVLDLSRTLPQTANTLAEGLYEISSSGFAGADGLLVLSKAAAAASAGLTDTDTSAKAIAAVLNAYGLSAASAGDVSDTLFQTVNLGVISFEELSGAIGDVVGTAAAAQISIAEVGAAIATMTLSGISGSEAATSLNRLLEASINPSEALASVYAQLGIESGAAALENKGLLAVMEEIRKATGGNITTLLALFPEIRAARGALALMSDEGRTYQRVSAAIEDENVRLGATQRALNEQLKAAGAQFALYRNGAQATAIEIGGRVLPVFVRFLEVTGDLATEAVPLLQRGITAVTPLLQNLYDTGEDVVAILGTLFDAASPVATALLAIAGVAILTGLNAVAGTVNSLTGVLADHQTVVLALAAVYAATLLPSVAAVTVAFNRFILTPVILGLTTLIGAAGAGAASLGTLAVAMLSVQAVATLGLAIALFGLARGFVGIKNAQNEAAEGISKLRGEFDALDSRRAQEQIAALREQALASLDVGRQYEGLLGTLKVGFNTKYGDQSIVKAAEDGKAAALAMNEFAAMLNNANRNLDELSRSTGGTVNSIKQIAIAQDIDLSKPFEESADARLQVLQYMKDLEKQTGQTFGQLGDRVGVDITAIEALAESIAKLQKQAGEALAGQSDVLGSFDPQAGAAEVEAATGRVKEAEQALADVRARQGEKQKADVGDVIALRNAEQRVAATRGQDADKVAAAEQNLADVRARNSDKEKLGLAGATELRKAEERLAEARTASTKARQEREAQTLEGSYQRAIKQATQFSADLATATSRGLDSGAVVKLLQQGPEQAGPILEQLVADQSGRLIEMVNAGERALTEINRRVVEQARLTALAVGSRTDQLSRDLGLAMQISAETIAQGATATVQSVAAKIGVPAEQVLAVARNFGITLGQAAQQGLSATSPTINQVALSPTALNDAAHFGGLLATAAQRGVNAVTIGGQFKISDSPYNVLKGTGPGGFAAGGLLTGPGTGTSDSLLIRASNREFVQRRAAVEYYGVDFMHQLNRLQIPRFATGGQVGGSSPIVRVDGGTQHSVSNHREIHIAELRAHDYNDFKQQIEREQRNNRLAGRARR